MASAAAGRGAQTMNSMYFKPMLRKAYHRKSDMVSDTVKLNGDEINYKGPPAMAAAGGGNGGDTTNWWIRDDRTGIYYPKGQEKVIQDIPQGATKIFENVNWFN